MIALFNTALDVIVTNKALSMLESMKDVDPYYPYGPMYKTNVADLASDDKTDGLVDKFGILGTLNGDKAAISNRSVTIFGNRGFWVIAKFGFRISAPETANGLKSLTTR